MHQCASQGSSAQEASGDPQATECWAQAAARLIRSVVTGRVITDLKRPLLNSHCTRISNCPCTYCTYATERTSVAMFLRTASGGRVPLRFNTQCPLPSLFLSSLSHHSHLGLGASHGSSAFLCPLCSRLCRSLPCRPTCLGKAFRQKIHQNSPTPSRG